MAIQDYPATNNLIRLLRERQQTPDIRALLQSVEMVENDLKKNQNQHSLETLLQTAVERYWDAADDPAMGVAVPQAFGKFQKEIRGIIGAGKGPKTAVPAAPNKSSAPQVDSESECGLEDEDPSRLGMAGKAAVSILGLPFVAVGAALGAAGSILGGVATAVDNIGKAAGPSSSRPTRKKSQRQ